MPLAFLFLYIKELFKFIQVGMLTALLFEKCMEK